METFSESIISPYQEMLHYETLWALPGMTESRISALFSDEGLPTNITENMDIKDKAAFEQLLPKTEAYLKNQAGFSVCLNGDFQYPRRLRDARHPVNLFYYKGDLSLLSTPGISITGARSASPEGLALARRLAIELTEENFTIISGLALGIDNASLESAISAGGRVIGVITTPVNGYFPSPLENNHLQDRISKEHLLISQVPFFRYQHESFQSHRRHFPGINATRSAISRATVIVEADDKSTILTQAKAALQQKRPLFIPDSCFENKDITWPAYYEKKGAVRVKSTQDILAYLQTGVKTNQQ